LTTAIAVKSNVDPKVRFKTENKVNGLVGIEIQIKIIKNPKKYKEFYMLFD